MKKTIVFICVLLFTCFVNAQAVYNGSSKHTFTTDYGKIDIGPFNSDWAHIYSDRPKFIFNKPVYTSGNAFSSYNNDLLLQTEGNTRVAINDDTGYVGIGGGVPKEKFQIGNAFTFHHGGDDYFAVRSSYSDFAQSGQWNYLEDAKSAFAISGIERIDFKIATGVGKSTGDLISWIYAISIEPNGNVGIGTSNPGSWRLAANGNIRAKEVKVETGWADYVFKEGYVLPTLEEVEKHIKENGHLINIPSAEEVAENGVLLGEMNKLPLEKIEELTLYILQQQNELKERNTTINQMDTKLRIQDKRIGIIENLLKAK